MNDSSTPIDLRSDTVTRPSQEMRAALLGKEAAMFLPSGTMANQVALRVLTRPGDDVIVSRESHIVWHEAGAAAANAGVQLTEIGDGGLFTAEAFETARKPREFFLYPPTTLVQVENTHNCAGGIVFPHGEAERIRTAAQQHGVATYLDGARLWNAAVATYRDPAELAAPFDLVSVSLSKGLGAPGGALLAGQRDIIDRAARYRRMLGGAMRQVGILAAAGIYALDHHMARLTHDHANAALIADRLRQSRRVILDAANVQTNILVFALAGSAPDAPRVIDRARSLGVQIMAFGPRTIRLVTHRDVSRTQCERAGEVLARCIDDD